MTRTGVVLLLFCISAACAPCVYADDFEDGSDIEPTTPVTGYSIKRSTPSITPAPTIPPTTAQNIVPVANAGPNQTVYTGALVVLDASGSYDSDGAIASYIWKQLGGPPIELLSHRTKHPSFSTGDTAATYVFQVTVRDANGAAAMDVVTILVRDDPTVTPTPAAVISALPSAVPLSDTLLTFPGANILFVVLAAILILLVGIVLKVALKPESS